MHQPEFMNICFWYLPQSLLGCEEEPDYRDRLHMIAPKIKERMMKDGSMMVTYQSQKGLPNFFRIVFQSSGLDRSDIEHLVGEFERLGKDLWHNQCILVYYLWLLHIHLYVHIVNYKNVQNCDLCHKQCILIYYLWLVIIHLYTHVK